MLDVSSLESEEQSHASDSGDDDGDEPHTAALPTSPTPPASRPSNPKSRKASAWTDPDDASLEVSLASSVRLRKLRNAPEEDAIYGREYERRLR